MVGSGPPRSADRLWSGVWIFLVLSSVFHFLSSNEADNDLWMHVLVGRQILESGQVPRVDHLSYTAAGERWVDHEWLTHVLFAAAYEAGGGFGLWLLKLGMGLLTAAALWRFMTRQGHAIWARAVVTVLALAVASRGFAVRPQVITYLATAWLLVMLLAPEDERPRPSRWLALIALLFICWANVHGGFVLGLGILALHAVFPPRALRWPAVAALAVAAAAVCVNPYGPALLDYIRHELSAPHPLTEWQPVAFGDPAQASFLLLVAALLMTLPFGRLVRRVPWYAALLAIVTFMAFRQQRHTPIVAIAAAPALADQLEGAAVWLRRRGFGISHSAARVVGIGVAALAVLQLSLSGGRLGAERFQLVYEGEEYPVGAVRFMRERRITGNLALPLDWGGYVMWHCAPGIKVSLDGRFATLYPPGVVQTNFDFFFDPGEAANGLLDRYPTTLVLSPTFAPVPVRHRPGWQVLYRDQVAELFALDGAGELVKGTTPRAQLPFP